jgi:hypothetical protein
VGERILERTAARDDDDADVQRIAAFLFRLIGDDERCAQVLRRCASAHPADAATATSLRIEQIGLSLAPSRPQNPVHVDPDIDAPLEGPLVHRSEHIRGIGLVLNSLRAQRDGDLDEMLTSAREAKRMAVEGSATWFAALQIRAWAEWELGRWAGAISSADEDLDHAHRYGDRSAMVMPQVVYALVMRSLDEVEVAATVRGHLPRRVTFMLVAQFADLDRWLHEQLEPERFAELAAEGRAMDPRQIQALVHEIASGHLQLDSI